MACATFSYALKSAYGPDDPKPLIDPITTRGLISWTFSQGNPSRSSTPGPKFSMMMSLFFRSSTKTALPSGDFMLTVIERLLQFSIVKYRLSALGTSRNWPRVASPAGDSSLITSAPSHASNCEQVGPACTCVMSRMRTPLSASIYISVSFVDAGSFVDPILLVHGLIRCARRIDIAVDHDVHQRRHSR